MGDSGKTTIPGDPDASELIKRIIHADPTEIMPPPDKKKPLPAEQVAMLRQWIAEGAEWGQHWAFQAPHRPVPHRARCPLRRTFPRVMGSALRS